MSSRPWYVVAATFLATVVSTAASAQSGGPALLSPFQAGGVPVPAVPQESRRPATQRIYFDFDLVVADALGTFGEVVDGAGGFQASGRFVPSPTSSLAYRLDLGFLLYGDETRTVCFAPPIGCRIEATLTTTNEIFYFGVGPELLLSRQRVYLFGTVGFTDFSTSSRLWGSNVLAGPAIQTEAYGDAVFGVRPGGGLRVRIAGTYRPVLLDIGAEYHRNGVARYLGEGDIVDNPDGTFTLLANRSEANIYSIRLGVSVAASSNRP